MSRISQSASKICLILLCLTACVAFYLQVLSEQNFMLLAIAVFSFYFGKPADTNVGGESNATGK